MNRMFIAYLVKNGVVIDEGLHGYELIVEELENGKYRELITGLEFENRFHSNKEISIMLCDRIDPNFKYKKINRYLMNDERYVYNLVNNSKTKRLAI